MAGVSRLAQEAVGKSAASQKSGQGARTSTMCPQEISSPESFSQPCQIAPSNLQMFLSTPTSSSREEGAQRRGALKHDKETK